jgi:hypothetical protein
MNEQIIILITIFLLTVITLCLHVWKAKKEVEYKKDERWQLIQYKAIKLADLSNYVLIILIAILTSLTLFTNMELTFSLNRVLIYGLIFIGLRNTIEFFALLVLDKSN